MPPKQSYFQGLGHVLGTEKFIDTNEDTETDDSDYKPSEQSQSDSERDISDSNAFEDASDVSDVEPASAQDSEDTCDDVEGGTDEHSVSEYGDTEEEEEEEEDDDDDDDDKDEDYIDVPRKAKKRKLEEEGAQMTAGKHVKKPRKRLCQGSRRMSDSD